MDRHSANVTTRVRRRNLAVIDRDTVSAAAKNRELRYPAFDVDPALTFLELDEDTPEREVTLLGRAVLAPHDGSEVAIGLLFVVNKSGCLTAGDR